MTDEASQVQPPSPPPEATELAHLRGDASGAKKSVWINLAYAILMTAVILLSKTFFESTAPGRLLEIGAFQFLQARISHFSGKRLPIVVVDISALPGGHDQTEPTSRAALQQIIDALVKAHAAAIGVDIDFSPGPAGWMSRADDPAFFDYCLSVNSKTAIRLGVYRTRQQDPEFWLGLAKYSPLAADLAGTVPEANNNTYRANQWVATQAHHNALPSMGYALARAYLSANALPAPAPAPAAPPAPPRTLRPLLIAFDAPSPENDPASDSSPDHRSRESEGRLLNYSKLAQLQTERLRTIHAQDVVDAADDFSGKMVILGDATLRNGGDEFIPPGHNQTPGVYFHASAAYTFAVEPLYEFTHLTRNLLDILLGLPFVAIAILKGKQTRRQTEGSADKARSDEEAESDWRRVERRALYSAAVIVIVLGLAFMLIWQIMWLDFILVIFALVAHPWLSRKFEALVDVILRKREASRRSASMG